MAQVEASNTQYLNLINTLSSSQGLPLGNSHRPAPPEYQLTHASMLELYQTQATQRQQENQEKIKQRTRLVQDSEAFEQEKQRVKDETRKREVEANVVRAQQMVRSFIAPYRAFISPYTYILIIIRNKNKPLKRH